MVVPTVESSTEGILGLFESKLRPPIGYPSADSQTIVSRSDSHCTDSVWQCVLGGSDRGGNTASVVVSHDIIVMLFPKRLNENVHIPSGSRHGSLLHSRHECDRRSLRFENIGTTGDTGGR